MIFKKKKKEEDEPLEDFFSDFFKLEEVSEKKRKKVERKVKIYFNKQKVIVTSIEIFLIIYLILAVLGFVPFF